MHPLSRTTLLLALAAVNAPIVAFLALRAGADAAGVLAAVSMLLLVGLGLGRRAELLRSLARAEEMALTDDLTGIPNRRAGRLCLEAEFAAAERGRQLAIVLFDLDQFKRYNDLHGHSVGDRALREFAGLLRAETRRMDRCARYGGEEFLSVLSDSGVQGVRRFVDRVRERLAEVGAVPPFTVSAGVALYRDGIGSPDELLEAADTALYQAKHLGRDMVRIAGVAGPGSDGAAANRSSPALPTGEREPRPGTRADLTAPVVLPLHDLVTGLHNRAGLVRRLQRTLDRAHHQPAGAFSVLLLDLDQFRLVNDSLGHAAGDELLAAVARRIECCIRPEDMAARISADEFAVFLFRAGDPADPARVAERVLASFARPFQVAGTPVFASASAGIVHSQGYTSAEEMLRDANLAMSRAKREGRSSYRIFEPALHARAVARLHLEYDLRRGLEAGEITVHYQPVVSLGDGRIVGMEALARWNHPTLGLRSPGDFIHVAEEMGLIVPLGHAVLARAIAALAAWPGGAPGLPEPWVSVNLTGREFAQPELEAVLTRLLEETGADPRRLRLELTESVLMHDVEGAVARLRRLDALGVTAQVDDFGTGYSSLNYLHRLPVNAVKIDHTFVSALGTDGREEALLGHVVALAHTLGLRVVAEGVERDGQRDVLASLGCDFGQGHYFLPPVDAERVQRLLLDGGVLPARALV
jgi:diguanylate cyclase (GGDEF)-like protein